jgi:hypothetical protein
MLHRRKTEALWRLAPLSLEWPINGLGSPGSDQLAKRRRMPATAAEAPTPAPGRRARPDVVHSSLYLPAAVHEALREAAFKERCKIHDIVMEGIELALKKRGYQSLR